MKAKILIVLILALSPSCIYVMSADASTEPYIYPAFTNAQIRLINEFEEYRRNENEKHPCN